MSWRTSPSFSDRPIGSWRGQAPKGGPAPAPTCACTIRFVPRLRGTCRSTVRFVPRLRGGGPAPAPRAQARLDLYPAFAASETCRHSQRGTQHNSLGDNQVADEGRWWVLLNVCPIAACVCSAAKILTMEGAKLRGAQRCVRARDRKIVSREQSASSLHSGFAAPLASHLCKHVI